MGAYPGSGIGMQVQPHFCCVAQGPSNNALQIEAQIDCDVEDVACATHNYGRIE